MPSSSWGIPYVHIIKESVALEIPSGLLILLAEVSWPMLGSHWDGTLSCIKIIMKINKYLPWLILRNGLPLRNNFQTLKTLRLRL